MRCLRTIMLCLLASPALAQQGKIILGLSVNAGFGANNNGAYFPAVDGIRGCGLDFGYKIGNGIYFETGVYVTSASSFVSDRRSTTFNQSFHFLDIPLICRILPGPPPTPGRPRKDYVRKNTKAGFYMDLGLITGVLTKATAGRTEVRDSFSRVNLRPLLGLGVITGGDSPIRFMAGVQVSGAVEDIAQKRVNGIMEHVNLFNFSLKCGLHYFF